MSEGEKGLMDCLLHRQDMRLLNVKFFRGDREVISEDDFRRQVASIEAQKTSGAPKSSRAPASKRPRVNVRELVSRL